MNPTYLNVRSGTAPQAALAAVRSWFVAREFDFFVASIALFWVFEKVGWPGPEQESPVPFAAAQQREIDTPFPFFRLWFMSKNSLFSQRQQQKWTRRLLRLVTVASLRLREELSAIVFEGIFIISKR